MTWPLPSRPVLLLHSQLYPATPACLQLPEPQGLCINSSKPLLPPHGHSTPIFPYLLIQHCFFKGAVSGSPFGAGCPQGKHFPSTPISSVSVLVQYLPLSQMEAPGWYKCICLVDSGYPPAANHNADMLTLCLFCGNAKLIHTSETSTLPGISGPPEASWLLLVM